MIIIITYFINLYFYYQRYYQLLLLTSFVNIFLLVIYEDYLEEEYFKLLNIKINKKVQYLIYFILIFYIFIDLILNILF